MTGTGIDMILSIGIHVFFIFLLELIPLAQQTGGHRYDQGTYTPFPGSVEVPSAADGFISQEASAPDKVQEPAISWLRPVFGVVELGPVIERASGRVLKTHLKHPPILRPPKFIPYIPPEMDELRIDPDLDVLVRTRPVTYSRDELEAKRRLFVQTMVEDLRDCRLDQIVLAEAIIRLRYFRLQEQLVSEGLEPDFSYEYVRDIYNAKMEKIRSALGGKQGTDYFYALLLEYRKDKIYEEKRGNSLLNSIIYDIYNCRSGTEEILMYLSRFHPELELGTVRGSVVKYDGTLMGHMDPAVKVGGQWLVLNTVALGPDLVKVYKSGELQTLESILTDYLPELKKQPCAFNRVIAKNGERVERAYEPYLDNVHPLGIKEGLPEIILWREDNPYGGAFRMMGREDRLFYDLVARYQGLGREKSVLQEEDPFADLLYHFLAASSSERGDLLDLYLRQRVTRYPVRFKRPLRVPDYIPEYGDLMTTLDGKNETVSLEISPGYNVPLARFAAHLEYIAINEQRMTDLGKAAGVPRKTVPSRKVQEFLLSEPGRGISAIFSPPEAVELAAGLIADSYDLGGAADEEIQRRLHGTSGRRIGIMMADALASGSRLADPLARRIELLKAVLNNKQVAPEESGVKDVENFARLLHERSRNEVEGEFSFADTVRQQGRNGLSPGFIKDMTELMGESAALSAFAAYLGSQSAAGTAGQEVNLNLDRPVVLEMLAYFDRYLMLEKSGQELLAAARRLFSEYHNLGVRVGAAQFLVKKRAITPSEAESLYLEYLSTQKMDVRELRSLLDTGLNPRLAMRHFQKEVKGISLAGSEVWRPDPEAARPSSELLRLDELMKIAGILDDGSVVREITAGHEALLKAFFAIKPRDSAGQTPNYGNGLNSLYFLSRTGMAPDDSFFYGFVEFGAGDPAGFFFAALMKKWFGTNRYNILRGKMIEKERVSFAARLKELEQSRSGRNGGDDRKQQLRPEGNTEGYDSKFSELLDGIAKITFLNALEFIEGGYLEASRSQMAVLSPLFALPEFNKDFEKIYGGELAAIRNEAVRNEVLLRAVEFGGRFSREALQKGTLDLNHAPTVLLQGEFASHCGTMARVIDSRNKPSNVVFTGADIYFDSLLSADNTPEIVAESYGREMELLQLVSVNDLDPKISRDVRDTEMFFRELAAGDFCDIRRLYILERLLKQAVLPEHLPAWIVRLARDSFRHEMGYLQKIRNAGGIEGIFEDYRSLTWNKFRRKWGEYPFSIRNLYGSLVLVKAGYLRLDDSGEFTDGGNVGQQDSGRKE